MYMKLINPRTKQVMTFPCAGEVYYAPAGELDLTKQKKWMDFEEASGNDARRFVLWPDGTDEVAVAVSEIQIPSLRNGRGAIVILTNWDAYLCNDRGHTIDRVHRAPLPETAQPA